MRGSPFSFSNFGRGLNALDSPYTLSDGEASDVLNMVSSPRGAIRKRFGSATFASAVSGSFPAISVVDNFNRTENPLNNSGKWSELLGVGKGKTNGTTWVQASGGTEGAYWNVTKQKNPAVSVEVAKAVITSSAGPALYVFKDTSNYYQALFNTVGENNTNITLLKKLAGVPSILVAESKCPHGLESGNSIGLTVNAGKVTVWVKRGGVWERVAEAADTSFTEGYGGFLLSNGTELDNFSLGEVETLSITSPFTSLFPCVIGGVGYLVGIAGKKIYSVTSGGEVTNITGAATVTEGKRWEAVQSTSGAPNRVTADGPVYLSNGTDPPLYWSGASKEAAVAEWTAKPEGAFLAVPKAKYLTYLGNRVWASGISTDTSALRFSGFASKEGEGEQADPTSWPKENVIWFEKEDGEEITGTGVVGTYLLVFKPHQTWVVYDLNEGENRKISDHVGCVSFRSIVETPQGTFFLTPDQGVFVTNGSSVREMSRNVRPILLGTDPNQARAAKPDGLKNAAAEYLNGHYYLSYEARDGSTKTLDFDTVLQSWWLHDIAGNDWVHWEPTIGEPFLYTCPNVASGGVVKAFVPGVFTDRGAVYTGAKGLSCYWVSPWEPFFQYVLRHRINQPQVKKRIRQLFVDGAGELVVKVGKKFGTTFEELKGVVDNADGSEPKSPVTLGTEAYPTQAARYYSLGVSRVWAFLFGNNSGEPLEVDAYACDLAFRKS